MEIGGWDKGEREYFSFSLSLFLGALLSVCPP